MKLPSLDRLGTLGGVVQGLVAVAGFVIVAASIVQPHRLVMVIAKDRSRVSPDLAARLQKTQADVNSVATDSRIPDDLKEKLNQTTVQLPSDYNEDEFGCLIVDISNPTDADAKDPRLEVKGFTTFRGVSVIGSDYNQDELAKYRDQWNQVSLQNQVSLPNQASNGETFYLQLPPIKSYNGHLALAIFGLNYGYTDARIIGVRADNKYLVPFIDRRGLHQYPYWLAVLSSVLFLSTILVWVQSRRIRELTPKP